MSHNFVSAGGAGRVVQSLRSEAPSSTPGACHFAYDTRTMAILNLRRPRGGLHTASFPKRGRKTGAARRVWKATKEYLNQRGTKIRVFRVCFRTPFRPPFSPHFPTLFPPWPCSLSHHLSPLHLPLYPPFSDSRKTPI